MVLKLKKLVLALGVLFAFSAMGLVGCGSSEPTPTEGDAEITKQTPKNENPQAQAAREAAKENTSMQTEEPPPPDGN